METRLVIGAAGLIICGTISLVDLIKNRWGLAVFSGFFAGYNLALLVSAL